MRLSKRLEAVIGLVSPGQTVADVGTDHGYVPVELVRRGTSPEAFAMDVREGPLARAREHITRAGLEQTIEVRLSDGLFALRPGEAGCVILAGMGGALMQRILSDSPETVRSLQELVLQPQSEVPAFRKFLAESGFMLLAEDLVLEDGKYYPMMKVQPPGWRDAASAARSWEGFFRTGRTGTISGQALSFAYGPLLLSQRHPVLKMYLEWEHAILQRIADSIYDTGERGNPGHAQRLEEVKGKLALNREAQDLYRQMPDR